MPSTKVGDRGLRIEALAGEAERRCWDGAFAEGVIGKAGASTGYYAG
jgi:hypothetical protein